MIRVRGVEARDRFREGRRSIEEIREVREEGERAVEEVGG